MATPSSAPASPPAADRALAAGADEGAERPPSRQPQPPQNVLAAPRLRAPSSRGLGAAEFGGAAGDVEAPGETFAQRVSWGPAESHRLAGFWLRDVTRPPRPLLPSGEGDLGTGGCGPAPRGAAGLRDPRSRPARPGAPPAGRLVCAPAERARAAWLLLGFFTRRCVGS